MKLLNSIFVNKSQVKIKLKFLFTESTKSQFYDPSWIFNGILTFLFFTHSHIHIRSLICSCSFLQMEIPFLLILSPMCIHSRPFFPFLRRSLNLRVLKAIIAIKFGLYISFSSMLSCILTGYDNKYQFLKGNSLSAVLWHVISLHLNYF